MVTESICAFRICESAEVFKGTYNLEYGYICEYPEFIQYNPSKHFDFYDDNYRDGQMPIEELYKYLCKFKDALLAINWNNVGVLLFTRQTVQLHVISTCMPKNLHVFKEDPFKLHARLAGLRKAEVLSLCVVQPLMYVACTGDDYVTGIYTQEGLIPLVQSLDSFNPDSNKLYRDMVLGDNDYYGICTVNGQSKYLRFNQDERIFEIV